MLYPTELLRQIDNINIYQNEQIDKFFSYFYTSSYFLILNTCQKGHFSRILDIEREDLMNTESLLTNFIDYFVDSYQFEKFCKVLLDWLDFDDIKVTKRSGDFGIDLTCNRRELADLNINTIHYIVQAKKYSLSHKVGPNEIREFKGTTADISTRRIFITTSDYTKSAKEEAKDVNHPVLLINGKQIIEYCCNLGDQVFDTKYYFNASKLDDLFYEETISTEPETNNLNQIERKITKNDVRARILRFPSEYKLLFEQVNQFDLIINHQPVKSYHLNKDKTYFAGVTQLYRECGFTANLDFSGARSTWLYDPENAVIFVDID